MSEKAKPRRVRIWLVVLAVVVVLLLALGYVVAYFVAGNRTAAGATVEGVPVGSMSPDEAEAKLEAKLAPVYDRPVTVSHGEMSIVLQPQAAGLKLDYEAAINEIGGGFSWNPAEIFNKFFGSPKLDKVPRAIDAKALATALEQQAPAFASEAVNATLTLTDGAVNRTESVNATELDLTETAVSVAAAFDQSKTEAEAVLAETPPPVTTEMVDAAIAEYAEPAMSGPVTISVADQEFTVTPQQIAEATTFSPQGEKLVPVTDGEKLLQLTESERATLELQETKDASYDLVDGKIVVVPAVEGKEITAESLAKAVEEAAVLTAGSRKATAGVASAKPEFTTEMAEQVKPQEVIGEFTTRYPHSSYRNTNLGKAAASVNGTVLMPGEIFSLNDTLGERTAANGYVPGYVIVNGRLVKQHGGGISQSATTLYNAAFFAGLEDIEHRPHTLYFDRYPAGREATVYWGQLDLKFRNNTKYPIYIQGFIKKSGSGHRGSITFRMWSIKTYDKIVATDPVKSGFYSGETVTIRNDPKCKPQSPIRGFTVTWSRLFYQGGEVVKKEDYSWKYSAGKRILCEYDEPGDPPGDDQ